MIMVRQENHETIFYAIKMHTKATESSAKTAFFMGNICELPEYINKYNSSQRTKRTKQFYVPDEVTCA